MSLYNKGLGFTLVELILAILLCSVSVAAALAGYNFLFNQIRRNSQVSALSLQMAYALESIRLHCLGAASIEDDSKFTAGSAETKDSFCFNSDKDIYDVTPNDPDDNVDYCYRLDANKALVLVDNTNNITTALIDAKYNPAVDFSYAGAGDPTIITARLTATAITASRPEDTKITKKEIIRFWFTKITK